MIPLLTLLASGVGGVLLSRWMLGGWVNHLSIYSVTWSISLFAYQLGLIAYNPICTEAWLYIAVAWMSVFLGAALVVLAKREHDGGPAIMPEFNPNYLRIPIIVLSLLGTVSLIQQIRQMQAEFGGVLSVLLLSPNEIYARRFEGELGGVPYLFFLGVPATCLAGAYTARVKKITVTALLPLLWAFAGAVISMQRAGVLIAAPLFAYAYIFSPRSQRFTVSKRGVMVLVLVVLLLFGFFILIGSHRGSYQYHAGQARALSTISDYASGFPSLYLYVSMAAPTFSQYLMHPEVDTYSFFASNTFAPVWRLLAKLGFRTYVPYYTPFYHTPEEGNQGTYLAYIHADFGPAGVVLVPCILSAVLTFFSLQNSQTFRMSRLMMYVNLLVVVTFSFSGWDVGPTYWFTSFVLSALLGWWIDMMVDRQHHNAVSATA
jgi:oligosaccharide repeat unit polymerase